MNFREAVKKIHPDINPDIKDAGNKMRTLVINKNDPEKIYLWMKRWGLVAVSNTEQKKESGFKFEWVAVNTLIANFFYNGKAVIRHKNGKVFSVLRTTNKRAYFVEGSEQKFCNINSIHSAWIKEEIV